MEANRLYLLKKIIIIKGGVITVQVTFTIGRHACHGLLVQRLPPPI